MRASLGRGDVTDTSRFEGAEEDVLLTKLGEEPFEHSGLSLTAIQTNEEKVEINSVF